MPSIGETKEAMERPGEGWLECIGLSVRRDQFPELFAAIGSRHGALNAAHFNLPSTPYTYIYAGGVADLIPPTPPSVPGETVDMVPMGVPASPISNVPMEPTPGLRRQVGPEDPAPSTRVFGGAPGVVSDTEAQYARTGTLARQTGAEFVEKMQQDVGAAALEAVEGQERREPAVPAGTDPQAARALADSKVAEGRRSRTSNAG